MQLIAAEERGAELILAPDRIRDVPERPVERKAAGRGAGVDHARDRVVPRVLLRGRARGVGILFVKNLTRARVDLDRRLHQEPS